MDGEVREDTVVKGCKSEGEFCLRRPGFAAINVTGSIMDGFGRALHTSCMFCHRPVQVVPLTPEEQI